MSDRINQTKALCNTDLERRVFSTTHDDLGVRCGGGPINPRFKRIEIMCKYPNNPMAVALMDYMKRLEILPDELNGYLNNIIIANLNVKEVVLERRERNSLGAYSDTALVITGLLEPQSRVKNKQTFGVFKFIFFDVECGEMDTIDCQFEYTLLENLLHPCTTDYHYHTTKMLWTDSLYDIMSSFCDMIKGYDDDVMEKFMFRPMNHSEISEVNGIALDDK